MKRIAWAVVAAIGLAAGSGTALAQHSGGRDGGAGHSGDRGGWRGGDHGGWRGGDHDGWHHGGWHGGAHFGIGIGFPGFYYGPAYGYSYYPYYAGYPYYSSYPYYRAYPAYTYYSDEPEYIEQGSGDYTQRDTGTAPGADAQYSYYCPDPAGYYPQLQSCPKGWLKVVPDRAPRPRPQ